MHHKKTNFPIIMGVDPGYGRVGIAVIEKNKNKDSLLHSECFETKAELKHPERIFLVANRIASVISEFNPETLALETILFSKNQKTALLVAEARGAIILEAARKNIDIIELNPNQIKLAITGYGKSDKKNIINMIEKFIKMEPKKRHDDEYDAIAAALTASAIYLSTDRK